MNQPLYFLYHFVHVFLLEQFDYNPKVLKFSKKLTMTTVLFAVQDTVALYFPSRFSHSIKFISKNIIQALPRSLY